MNWLTGSSKQNEAKRLIELLADPAQRDSVAWELIKLGEDAVAPLISMLGNQNSNLITLYEQVLARIPSATPALIQQLKSAHPIVRARAAETFFFSKDKAAMPALMEALKSEFFTVRARAALAISNLDDPRVLPYLLPLLKDAESEVRIYACAAIAKFRDPTTFDDIANVLLDDPKIEARQSAARALGETKHPAALPYLMDALRDSFWWYEREKSITDLLTAIEKMGASACETLIEAMSDKEANVRKYAVTLLGRLGDEESIEEIGMALYDLHNEVGKAAAETLIKFGSRAVDIFVEALRHPEAEIRENVVNALAKIQDPRAGALLIEMLNDPERNIRKQAIISLGERRETQAIPALQTIAADRTDREMGIIAKKILEGFK